MDKKDIKENGKIYEIGYLLVSSVPEEKVEGEALALREILSKKGAEFIGEEAPELRTLAYAMRKKIGSSYHNFEKGYFGWFKFELQAGDIEAVKKAFEENPNVLRVLVITTVKENTYLGKKSPVPTPLVPVEPAIEVEVAPPSTVDEMDKSIDAMVKEA
jgi:ribosomal protein S6